MWDFQTKSTVNKPPLFKHLITRFVGPIILSNNNYTVPRKQNKALKRKIIIGYKTFKLFATPVFSPCGCPKILTERTCTMYEAKIIFENATKNNHWFVNPQLTEFFMGYPLDYTALPGTDWKINYKNQYTDYN